MPSRSRCGNRSSTRAALLCRGSRRRARLAAVGLALSALAGVRRAPVAASSPRRGGFALYLIVTRAAAARAAEEELPAQASFLESLVDSMGAVASTLEPERDPRPHAATRRSGSSTQRATPPGARRRRAAPRGQRMIVPLACTDEELGVDRLTRAEPFHRGTTCAADACSPTSPPARSRTRGCSRRRGPRGRARARLTERLITAEQDERRRLSLFLHDGPSSRCPGSRSCTTRRSPRSRTGASRRRDRGDPELAREGARHDPRAARPLVRDRAARPPRPGVLAAVRALGDQIGHAHGITVAHRRRGRRGARREDAGRALPDHPRVAEPGGLRGPPPKIEVGVREREDGGFEAEIADDGVEERRRGVHRGDRRAREDPQRRGSRSTAASSAAPRAGRRAPVRRCSRGRAATRTRG